MTEAKRRFAVLLDAVRREPVAIRKRRQDVAVLVSAQEYDRLRGLNVAEFQRFCDRVGNRAAKRGLTGKKLAKRLDKIGRHCASLPDHDTRGPDEIIGYDEHGIPR